MRDQRDLRTRHKRIIAGEAVPTTTINNTKAFIFISISTDINVMSNFCEVMEFFVKFATDFAFTGNR